MAEQKNGFKTTIGNSMFVVNLFWKHMPKYLIGSLILAAMDSVQKVIRNTLVIKVIIDTIQYERKMKEAILFTMGVFAFSLIQGAIDNWFQQCVTPSAKLKMRKIFHGDLFEHAIKQDLERYDDPEFYDNYVFVTSKGLEHIWAAFGGMKTLFSSAVSVMTLLSVIFQVDIVGLFTGIASVGISFIFDNWRNKRLHHRDVALTKPERMQEYTSRVFTQPEYARELRVHHGFVDLMMKKYQKSVDIAKKMISEYAPQIVISDALTYFLSTYLLIYGIYCGYLAYQIIVIKSLTLGDFVGMYQAVRLLRNQMMWVTYAAAPTLIKSSLYITKYRVFLQSKPQIVDNTDAKPVSDEIVKLCVKNVNFSYNEKEASLLKNINMNIVKNAKIAIVGYNGAGKSTLVKLLLRLYDISSGEISLNGENIKKFQIEDYRRQFGTVFQDFQIYAASFAENVVMDTYDDLKQKKVLCALEKSGLHKKIETLENGIQAQMLQEFDDKGIMLSGGEAQKLAISRVIYSDAKCIIMDEPSSALDPISEYNMNKLIHEVSKDKMVIYISHRLSSTVLADYIYMFENGEIVEQGTHKELMQQNGRYAYMFNIQAKQYIVE